MPLACKLCIAERGLKFADIDGLPQTQAALIEHFELLHHLPVQRDGETLDQMHERFVREHPDVLDCENCARENAPWSRKNWEQAHASPA
jgi:hypothetical protein